ncbi:MAG: type II toxin-antitoxin system ParD family antitoxin [Caulobacteraceae bacterium]
MSRNVRLGPELERFAKACVEEGRYNNVSEVVRSGLRMLQQAEEQRAAFLASLKSAEAEADRTGSVSLEDALGAMDRIIAEVGAETGG